MAVYNVLSTPSSSLGFKHSAETLKILSDTRKGELNPMYNKSKSPEFIAQMNKSIKGKDNPMYSKGTPVYVYDSNKNLIGEYNSVKSAVKDLKKKVIIIQ